MQCSMAAEANFKRWVDDGICQMVSQLGEFIKKFEEESLPPPEQVSIFFLKHLDKIQNILRCCYL